MIGVSEGTSISQTVHRVDLVVMPGEVTRLCLWIGWRSRIYSLSRPRRGFVQTFLFAVAVLTQTSHLSRHQLSAQDPSWFEEEAVWGGMQSTI